MTVRYIQKTEPMSATLTDKEDMALGLTSIHVCLQRGGDQLGAAGARSVRSVLHCIGAGGRPLLGRAPGRPNVAHSDSLPAACASCMGVGALLAHTVLVPSGAAPLRPHPHRSRTWDAEAPTVARRELQDPMQVPAGVCDSHGAHCAEEVGVLVGGGWAHHDRAPQTRLVGQLLPGRAAY